MFPQSTLGGEYVRSPVHRKVTIYLHDINGAVALCVLSARKLLKHMYQLIQKGAAKTGNSTGSGCQRHGLRSVIGSIIAVPGFPTFYKTLLHVLERGPSNEILAAVTIVLGRACLITASLKE